MPPKKETIDDKDLTLLRAVVHIRTDHHACSIQQIAERMLLSKNTIKWRIDALRRMGYLDWTEAYGSIHLTPAGLTESRRRSGGTQSPASS